MSDDMKARTELVFEMHGDYIGNRLMNPCSRAVDHYYTVCTTPHLIDGLLKVP